VLGPFPVDRIVYLSANAGTSLDYSVALPASASPTSSSSLSAPVAFTSRALTSADAGVTLVCSSAQAATVPAGLGSGFGCAIRGTVTVTAGSGATVNDVRTTGATSPYCALVQIGTDVYDVVGGKA
jgi:hypothetical protein